MDDCNRSNALCKAFRGRVKRLAEVVNSRRSIYPADDCTADVQEDVAYSGEDMEDADMLFALKKPFEKKADNYIIPAPPESDFNCFQAAFFYTLITN